MVYKDNFANLPLRRSNLREYAKQVYNIDLDEFSECSHSYDKIKPLLQKDYGGDQDCTLTSITACCDALLTDIHDIQKIYAVVESIAYDHGYNPDKDGTSPFKVRSIYRESLKELGLLYDPKVKYLKNIFFNSNTIYNNVTEKPMILSLWKDNRFYYYSHSVTVVGISIYVKGEDSYPFIQVYDNWSKELRFIDYKRMSTVANLVY